MDQVLACTLKYKVLPQVDRKRTIVTQSGKANLKAILITSLSSGYFENVRNMYWEHPTVNGDVVEVFQPSQEHYVAFIISKFCFAPSLEQGNMSFTFYFYYWSPCKYS